MTKFKVGDKVRILRNVDEHKSGTIRTINRHDPEDKHYEYGFEGGGWVAEKDIELVSDKPTKNQRITTLEQNVVSLESEVAELKAKVEALEKAQSPAKTITVIADAIARYNAKQPTPNEQRKAIIAEAKAFVKKYSGVVPHNSTPYTTESGDTIVKLFVNKDKRIVTAVPHLVHVNTAISSDRRFAKCAPDDVFNADIGKAIALGRALGLDVSRFEQADKPTEVVVGQVVHKTQGVLKGSVGPVTSVGDTSFAMGEAGLTFTGDKSINGEYVWAYKKDVEINDDTEAVY